MSSTFSPLKIELITTGEQSGTWGDTTNTNLGTALEEAIVGNALVTFASADVTLTLTNVNTTQTARNLRLELTGTSGGARNLYVPAIEKPYIVANGLADAVTVINASGTGVVVPAGKSMWVYNNGSDVVNVVSHLTALSLGTALPITSGGTGSTSTAYCGLTTNVTGTLPIANGGTGSTSTTYCGLTTNVTGTLPVANGGTGATTFTSGALLKGNTTSAISAASAADIVSAIGSTAVTNATNATNATQITNAGGWGITPSGTTLFFSYNGTNVAKLTSAGDLTVIGDVTAYGSV